MEVTMDGDKYTGRLSRGTSAGFITGLAVPRTVNRTVTGSSEQFHALLANSRGKALRCQFQTALTRGQGVCQTDDGRMLDLVQGD